MKKTSTLFLQAVIVLVGMAALAFMLWEPHIEGRNAQATLSQIYFNDPFLAYAYIASIPFFIALVQAFKILGHVRQNNAFSQPTLTALRKIKYCALLIIGFAVVSVIFMYPFIGDQDDQPVGILMRLVIIFASIVVASLARMFERILQDALYKSELA